MLENGNVWEYDYEDEGEYEGEYQEYTDEENERTVYTNHVSSESKKEYNLRKRRKTGEEMETDKELPPIVIPPAHQQGTSQPKKPEKIKEKKPRRKMMPAPIEHVEEFNISKYIRDLPCGLSIGQASAHILKYRSAMLKSVQRTREANYADNESTVTTSANVQSKSMEKKWKQSSIAEPLPVLYRRPCLTD
jgi:hypothetical protein